MNGLRGKTLIAYLLICTVWGSTYLAIRVGVADLPPLLFAGSRFLIAGLLMGAVVLAMGQAPPRTRREWVTLAVSGTFLLVGGNGLVVWAEQHVESGAASVFIATAPLWLALLDAVTPGGSTRFTGRVILGLALGFLGSALLAGVRPGELAGMDLRGPAALVTASASWSIGTIFLKRRGTTTTPYVSAATQMVVAGSILTVAGLLTGQAGEWTFTWRGTWSLVYLVVFGSIIGYTAYAYAIKHASATVVGTYAYVNPVVAVLLGWSLLGEAITPRMAGAMVLVLGAVVLVQLAPHGQTNEQQR